MTTVRFAGCSDDYLNALVEEEVMLRVPCTGWIKGNYGSRGGPYLKKSCGHEGDTCYPSIVIGGSVYGPVGGPDHYTSSLDACTRMLAAVARLHSERTVDVRDALAALSPILGVAALMNTGMPRRIVEVVLEVLVEEGV